MSSDPNVQKYFAELVLATDPHPLPCPKSCLVGKHAAIKVDPECRHATEKMHHALELSKCDVLDVETLMEASSTNQEDWTAPDLFKISGMNGELCDSSTFNLNSGCLILELAPDDIFELCDSVESPRVAARDEDAYQASFDRRQYRAWMGSRNLHVQ